MQAILWGYARGALHGSGVCPLGVGTRSSQALGGFFFIKKKKKVRKWKISIFVLIYNSMFYHYATLILSISI